MPKLIPASSPTAAAIPRALSASRRSQPCPTSRWFTFPTKGTGGAHRPAGRTHRSDDRNADDRAHPCESRHAAGHGDYLTATISGASRSSHNLRSLAKIHDHFMGDMFGPANLPKEIITRLLEIMRETEVIETLGKPGFVLTPSTPEALGQFLSDQIDAWKISARAAGIAPESPYEFFHLTRRLPSSDV